MQRHDSPNGESPAGAVPPKPGPGEALAASGRRYLYLLLLAVLSLQVFWLFIESPGLNLNERATLVKSIYGTADKPFVYRALLPLAVRGIVAAIPEPARRDFAEQARSDPGFQEIFKRFNWEIDYALEYLIALSLMYACLVGFAVAVWWLVETVYSGPPWIAEVTSLLALLALPPSYRYQSYIYDFASLFLFTTGLVLIYRRRWVPFLVVYLLACLNKETTILQTLVFVLYYWRSGELPRVQLRRLLAAQVGIFVAVKLALTGTYGGNPGEFVEFHLLDHNMEIVEHYGFGPLLATVLFAVFCGHRWEEKPRFARVALVTLPVLIGLTVFLGFLDEYRDYYEAYPAVLLLFAHSAARFIGVPLLAREEAPGPAAVPA